MMKPDAGWAIFSTPLGICGVSWDTHGITSFLLPEVSGKSIESHLKNMTGSKRASAVMPSLIKELIRKVKAHLKGTAQDFSQVPLHFVEASDFMLSVYRAAQKIRSGNVVTYGQIAACIGNPKAARAVGSALGKNPIPLIVPCHRVVASSGNLGGYSAPGGVKTKAALLEIEGIRLTRHWVAAKRAQW
jgi:methylated-DNA-[protein]-cysteine S-methyltransferase